MTYRTKQEAYDTGHIEGYDFGYEQGFKAGIKQERARLKKKAIVNPLYNRPLDLKERVNREAEVEYRDEDVRKIMAKRSQELVDAYDEVARKDKQPFSIIKWISKYLP